MPRRCDGTSARCTLPGACPGALAAAGAGILGRGEGKGLAATAPTFGITAVAAPLHGRGECGDGAADASPAVAVGGQSGGHAHERPGRRQPSRAAPLRRRGDRRLRRWSRSRGPTLQRPHRAGTGYARRHPGGSRSGPACLDPRAARHHPVRPIAGGTGELRPGRIHGPLHGKTGQAAGALARGPPWRGRLAGPLSPADDGGLGMDEGGRRAHRRPARGLPRAGWRRRPRRRDCSNGRRRPRQALVGASLPTVLTHNDYGPWNIHRDGDRITVIDWELGPDAAGRRGPALADLIYFATEWHLRARRLRGREAELRGFRELFLRPTGLGRGRHPRHAVRLHAAGRCGLALPAPVPGDDSGPPGRGPGRSAGHGRRFGERENRYADYVRPIARRPTTASGRPTVEPSGQHRRRRQAPRRSRRLRPGAPATDLLAIRDRGADRDPGTDAVQLDEVPTRARGATVASSPGPISSRRPISRGACWTSIDAPLTSSPSAE